MQPTGRLGTAGSDFTCSTRCGWRAAGIVQLRKGLEAVQVQLMPRQGESHGSVVLVQDCSSPSSCAVRMASLSPPC